MKKVKSLMGRRNILFLFCALLIVALMTSVFVTNNQVASAAKDGDAFIGITYKLRSESAEDSMLKADKFNESIAEEGMVLLKNKASALPLADGAKVSLLGKNWNDPAFGGGGSSSFSNSSGRGIGAIKSMEDAGFKLNPTLMAFYADTAASGPKRPVYSYNGSNMATGEAPVSLYTDPVKASFADYHDAAIILITRVGGEGMDVSSYYSAATAGRNSFAGGSGQDASEHYLQLDNNEKALISLAKEKFSKIVLVINAAQPIEFKDAELDKLDAIVWAGLPGSTGFAALGRILDGEVNPSGRTVDTYERNFLLGPGFQNYADNRTPLVRIDPSDKKSAIVSPAGNALITQTGVDKDGKPTYNMSAGTEVTYEEGIYVGYRYYETRAFVEDSKSGATKDAWYKQNVLYPFGYGLSYTTFEYSNYTFPASAALTKDGKITVSVDVKNTGSAAGKEVVQLYYSAPYTDKGVEKSHVVLGDFAKTKLLASNETQTLSMEISVKEMASYDWNDLNKNNYKTYELDAGNYSIIIGSNAHAWADAPAAAKKIMTVATGGFQYEMDIDGKGDKTDNQFNDVSAGLEGKGINLMTRSDFAGTYPSKPTLAERTITAETAAAIAKYGVFSTNDPTGSQYDTSDKPWYTATMPTQRTTALTGTESNIVKFPQLIGKSYDDSLWDTFMDQFTVPQLEDIVRFGKFRSLSNPVLQIPIGKHPDGPFGFVGQVNGYGSARCYYVSPCILAAAFNKELAKEQGRYIGEEGVWLGYNAIYGPGVNIHRNPFCGRNFEYYSEDSVLSGVMSQYVSLGMREYGVIPFFKHFALNDQETNRSAITTWASEQTMREIYLKPYQVAVEKGGANGIMTAFNRIGMTWCGASYPLLTNVLRKEWGFKGVVVTDWGNGGFMNLDEAIRAGNDLSLAMGIDLTRNPTARTATQVKALRNSVKNIYYATLHSNAMSKLTEYNKIIGKPYKEDYNEVVDGQPGYTGAPTVNYVFKDYEYVTDLKIDFGSKTFENAYPGLTYDIVLGDSLDRRATGQQANKSDLPDEEWIANGWMEFNATTGLVTIKRGAPSGNYQLTVALKVPATTTGYGYAGTTGDVYIGEQATVMIEYYASEFDYKNAQTIKTLEEELAKAQAALTAAQNAANAAKAAADAAQADADANAEEAERLDAEAKAAQESFDELKAQYDSLKKDFDELKKSFDESQEGGCGSMLSGGAITVIILLLAAAAITVFFVSRRKRQK